MMMKLRLSVIICTHNPRRDFLEKVLASLEAQTLPRQEWELLMIDNASDRPLSSAIDLSWHPYSIHIHEAELGLIFARMLGIKESRTDLLVFVDDDNVLDTNYLEVALQISQDFPFIGAWGGQIIGEFEVKPPTWSDPYLPYLAIRQFNRDKWSNCTEYNETTPCGAGLCVRKAIANYYLELTCNDPFRQKLGRKGHLICSGEDADLALTACEIGFGTGQFSALKLSHLIPATRLEETYLLQLYESMGHSNAILQALHSNSTEVSQSKLYQKLREYYLFFTMSSRERRFHLAYENGRKTAIQELKINHENSRRK